MAGRTARPHVPPEIVHQYTDRTGQRSSVVYVKGSFLGKGGFSQCYEFRNKDTGRVSAGKVISKASLVKERMKQRLHWEIAIHRRLRHKHILQFERSFEDDENVYILLELCKMQSMMELMKRRTRLTEPETRYFMLQLLDAVQEMHRMRVIHRDLKLGNLMLNDQLEIKVGDFGLAAQLDYDGERKRTICGTPNYIAPEMLDGQNGHSYEVDVWAIGVILFTMLVGKPPFETRDVKSTYRRIRANCYSFPETLNISPEAKSLIRKILRSEPERRPSLNEVFKHEFFQKSPVPRQLPTSAAHTCPSLANLTYVNVPRELGVLSSGVTLQEASVRKALGSLDINAGDSAENKTISTLSRKPSHIERSASFPASVDGGDDGLVLRTAHAEISNSFMITTPRESPGVLPLAPVWVTAWADFSAKYGLGYRLSSGVYGVYFNDCTKIVSEEADIESARVTYYERERGPRGSVDKPQSFVLREYPSELRKKAALLRHFAGYIERKDEAEELHDGGELAKGVYVRKWLRTKHAVLFRLSNRSVQVSFFDKTEVILWSESKYVTYRNKRGERLTYTTAGSAHVDELTRRLRYIKDVISRLISAGPPPTSSAVDPAANPLQRVVM